ncbi:MAG: hypothetical protein GY847_30370 [Proteobacteria bacterium]|nr:hypothetical protein [Pseudomonadota bacterium]
MVTWDAGEGPSNVGRLVPIWLCFALTPLLVACGTDTVSSSGVVSSGDLDIIVPPGKDGNLPADLWVGCKNGPQFQVSDLEEIVPLAEGDPGGVAQAIKPFLSSGEGAYWPQEDWLILRETENEILLVNDGGKERSFMEVSRVDGAWEWSGAKSTKSCSLFYLVPEGLNAVDWYLASPAPLSPLAATLKVFVTERECVSGQELGDRLVGPQVVMTDHHVRIAFAAEPPPGDSFTCPANPEVRVTVELPEPLGFREIIEGLAIGIDLEDYLP